MRRLTRSIRSRFDNLVLAPRFGAITSVRTSLPMVALTFDDGPHPTVTQRLVDMFARHGAQATHFLVGAAAEARPDLVHALTDAGHEVANHTYSHTSLVRLSQEERRTELVKGREALGPRSNAFVRPPYGHYDMECARDVHALGMRCVMWTRHISDWEPASVEVLTERLRKAVIPGNIVLLHEALYTATAENRQDRERMLEAVDTVLGELAGRVRFGTLTELLKSGRPVLRLITRFGEDEFIEAQRPGSVQEEGRAQDDILAP